MSEYVRTLRNLRDTTFTYGFLLYGDLNSEKGTVHHYQGLLPLQESSQPYL